MNLSVSANFDALAQFGSDSSEEDESDLPEAQEEQEEGRPAKVTKPNEEGEEVDGENDAEKTKKNKLIDVVEQNKKKKEEEAEKKKAKAVELASTLASFGYSSPKVQIGPSPEQLQEEEDARDRLEAEIEKERLVEEGFQVKINVDKYKPHRACLSAHSPISLNPHINFHCRYSQETLKQARRVIREERKEARDFARSREMKRKLRGPPVKGKSGQWVEGMSSLAHRS